MNESKTQQFIEKVRLFLKKGQLLYPTLLAFVAIIILVAFVKTMSFIREEINIALAEDTRSGMSVLDDSKYQLVASHLGLTEAPVVTPSEVPSPTPAPVATLTKETLQIAIYNGSGKTGVATTLQQALTSAGFATSTVGNNPSVISRTRVESKSAASELLPAILDVVQKQYDPETGTLSATSTFDVVIIIGKS